MFKATSLKIKLLLAFFVVATFSVVVGGLQYFFTQRMVTSFKSITDENVPNLARFISISSLRFRMVVPIAQLVGTNTTPEDAKRAQGEFDGFYDQYQKDSEIYESGITSTEEKDLWFNYKNGSFKQFIDLSREQIRLSGTNSKADQEKRDKLWAKDFEELRKKNREEFGKIIEFQTNGAKAKSDLAAQAEKSATLWTALAIACCFVLAMAIGYILATVVSKSIQAVSDQLSDGAQQVFLASNQLSTASQQLAAGASSSAASLEEGVASIEELSSMVKMNASNAQQAAQLSVQGSDQAKESLQEIENLVQRMSDIQKSSKKIEEIIGIIDDIAFQTNLLALNAAVEAARAGEQGKGFAVVADAVRNLAQKSSSSAKDISDLIKQSVDLVDDGVNIADKGSQSLKELGSSIKKISDLNQEIAAASNEQANGVNQLGIAMTTLDKTVQSNAASSEEVAASAEELSAQSENMKGGVDNLIKIVQGGAGESNEFGAEITIKPQPPKKNSEMVNHEPKSNLVPLPKKKVPSQGNVALKSTEVIPFDEDNGDRKVGTTDDF